MDRIHQEANSKDWSEDILRMCADDPFYFKAFRVYVLLYIRGEVLSNPVPFIHRLWYLPLILCYVTAKRIEGTLRSDKPRISGHIFCCTSTASYRSESFYDLVEYFTKQGMETTLYTVSACKSEFSENRLTKDVNIVTYPRTFTTVSPSKIIKSLPYLWAINKNMSDVLEITSFKWRIIVMNFLVTEYIKYTGLSQCADGIESFHTYSPMPYQLEAVEHKKIYTHQHGIQAAEGDRAMAIPKYAPINYFTYGEYWSKEFTRKGNPESKVFSVGNPRFDSLFERREERQPAFDLLFTSGTHILDRMEFDEHVYKELVDAVVELCDAEGWELVIKLHPKETKKYYEKWGYDRYVTDCTSIEDLLLRSDIAITDSSTTFIESILLGTPMVFALHSPMELRLEGLDTIEGLSFPENLDQAVNDIRKMKGHQVTPQELEKSDMIQIGNTEEKICRVVTKEG